MVDIFVLLQVWNCVVCLLIQRVFEKIYTKSDAAANKKYAFANIMSDQTPESGTCDRIVQVRIEVTGPRGKAALAKMLGISPTTYQSYEAGRVPPADVLVKMAEVAQVDVRWLLTGRDVDGPAVTGNHPVLQRAGVLLSRHPNAAAALGAFVDVLAQSMKFPAKAAGPAESQAPAGLGGLAETPLAEGEPVGADAGDAGEADHWIPILGRSAAGVPRFWDDDDADRGVTTLGELIARHASTARRARSAEARGEDLGERETVQLIALAGREGGDCVEFVNAPGIKARHGDAFGVRIDGESMSPDIAHGDVVILSPSHRARDGHRAVVQLRRQIGVTCKLFRREGESVHLVPINEQFRPQTFDASELEWALRVLARVRAT